MASEVKLFTKEFLEKSVGRNVRLCFSDSNECVAAVAILIKALKRKDVSFSVQKYSEEVVPAEKDLFLIVKKNKGVKEKVFEKKYVQDGSPIEKRLVCDGSLSELSYKIAKEISLQNADLAKIAIIGSIPLNHELSEMSFDPEVVADASDIQISKGLTIYPATRPLQRALEYSTMPYIPGVTGNSAGVSKLLEEAQVSSDKSLLELSEDERSRLITAILMRKQGESDEIVGNTYIATMCGSKEDAREVAIICNACNKLGRSDISLLYLLEVEAGKTKAQELYTSFKTEFISSLKTAESLEKISGNGFVILNAKDRIKKAILNAVCATLAKSNTYEKGTVLIAMAHDENQIAVTAKTVGKKGRNVKEVFEQTLLSFDGEEQKPFLSGNETSVKLTLSREKEGTFLENLQKALEVEVMKM